MEPIEPVALARHFHSVYERLAPSFGYETRTETRAFDPDSANGKLMTAVASEVLSYLASAAPQAASAWIPVSERLPELNTEVLVWFDTRAIPATAQLCMFKGIRQWMWPSENDPWEGEAPLSVTHWQPLPAPPGKTLARY